MGVLVEELTQGAPPPDRGLYEEALERAVAFARRHGAAHAALALYASVPLGLTPDLVHLLRVNFVPNAPWIAEADLLLSRLCREVGGEYYEMDVRVREVLLDEFAADERFGAERLRRAAEFLHIYAGRARKAARLPDARAFWQAQEWAALAHARPAEAARALAAEMGRKITAGDHGESLRVARLTHLLATPLGEHDEFILYAAGLEGMLSGADAEDVFDLFDAAGSNDAALSVAGVTLPTTPQLADHLGLPAPLPAVTHEPPPPAPPAGHRSYAPGLTLTHSFRVSLGGVTRLAWSPDGKALAAPSMDSNVYVWEESSGQLDVIPAGAAVRGAAWSPDGLNLAAVAGNQLLVLSGFPEVTKAVERSTDRTELVSVAWLDEGPLRVPVAAGDGGLVLFSAPETKFDPPFIPTAVNVVAGLPRSQRIAYGTVDGGVWFLESDKQNRKKGSPTSSEPSYRRESLPQPPEPRADVLSLATDPEAKQLAAGRRDGFIRVWDVSSKALTARLEGHAGAVTALSFSADGGLLASKSADGTVRLWDTRTWEALAVIDEPVPEGTNASGVAFHPTLPGRLATLDATGGGVRLWEIDFELLTRRGHAGGEIHYRLAKVAVLGDDGTVKSALARRLSEHGGGGAGQAATREGGPRPLYTERLPAPDGREEVREVLLLEVLGKPTSRLADVLRSADVALIAVESLHNNEQVSRWEEKMGGALLGSKAYEGLKKFVVETISQPTGLPHGKVDPESVPRLVAYESHHYRPRFDAFFRVDVQNGEGAAELASALREAINWDTMSALVTTKLFEDLKSFVMGLEPDGAGLVESGVLSQMFREAHPAAEFGPAEFETALRALEGIGLLRLLDFGGLVLLRQEALDEAADLIISDVTDKGFYEERV